MRRKTNLVAKEKDLPDKQISPSVKLDNSSRLALRKVNPANFEEGTGNNNQRAKKAKNELKTIFWELTNSLFKEVKSSVIITFMFSSAAGVAFIVSLLSFEHDPAMKSTIVEIFGFLAIWLVVEVISVKMEIPFTKLIKEKILKWFGK
jgi:hypothetical protein